MSTAEIQTPPRERDGTTRLIGPPDHLGLPQSDGRIVENLLEHPQGSVLSDSLWPILAAIHPDGQFCVGRDVGIYYKWVPDDLISGAIAPDWFYVPDVPPLLDGEYRRSYVLWKEVVPPLIVLEFASGDGSEERDRTPPKGKFWVYERAVRPAYYGIHVAETDILEMYELHRGQLRRVEPNGRGRYPVPELGVELGTWAGRIENLDATWMRWFLPDGRLLRSAREEIGIEFARAEAETARAGRLSAQLRALGVEPEA